MGRSGTCKGLTGTNRKPLQVQASTQTPATLGPICLSKVAIYCSSAAKPRRIQGLPLTARSRFVTVRSVQLSHFNHDSQQAARPGDNVRAFSTKFTMTLTTISNKQATSYAEADAMDTRICEYTLRKVLSWLEVPDLLCGAGLVSTRWAAAAGCKEVWRRRMHKAVLETLFSPQHSKQQQQEDADGLTAAAIAAVAAMGVSPARLFAGLYGSNLLVNGSFLERSNSSKGSDRRLVWEPTFNPRGMTWAHPFDFFPELCPLPEEGQGFGATPAKPFSIGCLATSSGAWSEVVQVVDLQAVLQARGVPEATAAWLIGSGLTLELSVMVAGGAAAGGEYQVVLALVTAADAATAATAELPLSALPKSTLPFGHPPPGCAGIPAVTAAQLAARGLCCGSRVVARAPLHPAPGIWTRCSCRAELPRGSSPISHVVVALRGRASRNSRLGHYATKFADARLSFLTADQC